MVFDITWGCGGIYVLVTGDREYVGVRHLFPCESIFLIYYWQLFFDIAPRGKTPRIAYRLRPDTRFVRSYQGYFTSDPDRKY